MRHAARPVAIWFHLFAALSTVGCGDSKTSPAGAPGSMPCDVDAVLTRVCQECHAAEPRYGAPMPLASIADFQKPAITAPELSVYELARRRIDDPESPMPPRGGLSASDRAILSAWLDARAPADDGSARCDVASDAGADAGANTDAATNTDFDWPSNPGVGVDELPCEPSHTFTMHADGDPSAPLDVPAGATDLYLCAAFKAPFGKDQIATALAPIIDAERVVHHWILFQTKEPQEEGHVFPCGALPASDAVFLTGWAPGGRNQVLPGQIGLELPDDEDGWLLLQIHYYNSGNPEAVPDRSGVAVCTSDTPRAQTAGVLTVGTLEIDLPARSTGNTVSYTCPGRVTQLLGAFTALASSPHMHRLGTAFRSEVLHANGSTTTLSDVARWDFGDQQQYPLTPAVQIKRGDGVRVTCNYDNPGDGRVTFGEGTGDEMCFDFLLVYPISQWPAGVPRFCVDIERFGF